MHVISRTLNWCCKASKGVFVVLCYCRRVAVVLCYCRRVAVVLCYCRRVAVVLCYCRRVAVALRYCRRVAVIYCVIAGVLLLCYSVVLLLQWYYDACNWRGHSFMQGQSECKQPPLRPPGTLVCKPDHLTGCEGTRHPRKLTGVGEEKRIICMWASTLFMYNYID